MEEHYKPLIRQSHYRFVTGLKFLSDVFDNAELYRFQRHTELSKLISENTYVEFLEKFGEETFKEFNTIELFYKYMLIHSIFISAYSAFESQLTAIAQLLEKYVPSQKKIKDFKRRRQSLIEKIREYLYSAHQLI